MCGNAYTKALRTSFLLCSYSSSLAASFSAKPANGLFGLGPSASSRALASAFACASAASLSRLCWLFLGAPAFLGARVRNIFLPSSDGILSTFASSSRSLAKRRRSTSPCSLKTMERPLKNTYAFTLLPSVKNSWACFSLNA